MGVAALLVTLTGAGPVHAHADAPAGLYPFVHDGALIGGLTTYGLLTASDEGWAWTCTAPEESRFAWAAPDLGRILWATAARGLVETTDQGCTTRVRDDALQEHFVVDGLARGPELFVLTGSPDADNAIFRSQDQGETFTLYATWRASSPSPCKASMHSHWWSPPPRPPTPCRSFRRGARRHGIASPRRSRPRTGRGRRPTVVLLDR